MKSILPCVVGISVFLQVIAQDEIELKDNPKVLTARLINERSDARADANLTRRIENATFTQGDNATREMETTPEAKPLHENKIEFKIGPMVSMICDSIDSNLKTTRVESKYRKYVADTEDLDEMPNTYARHFTNGFLGHNATMLRVHKNKRDPIYLEKIATRNSLYLDCAEETGVSPEMILILRTGKWAENKPTLKAWVQCVLVNYGLMTDQSVLRLDVAFKNMTKLQKKQVEAKIDKCLPTRRMVPMEIAWRFARCYQKEDPHNSLF